MSEDPTHKPEFTASESKTSPISIWQPHEVDGETVFIRAEPLALGDHYADRVSIPAQKPALTKRICLFGESVAAGYLYAPHFTPAKALSSKLDQSIVGSQYEVIDLARTNETLSSLANTIDASIQLNPDVFVIMAGNNWTVLETPEISPYAGNSQSRREYAASVEESGLMGPTELAAKQLLNHSAEIFSRIADTARSNGVDVVIVVPEVNLADWAARQPVTWLPADGTAGWHELYEKATAALALEQWEDARATAFEMFELDRYACPTTFRIVAAAQTGLADFDGAATACRAEIDAEAYATACQLPSPRANRMAIEILNQSAKQHGFGLVDLAKIFAKRSASRLSGRQLFLDYCHLAAEGIELAMSAVAVAIDPGEKSAVGRPAIFEEQQALAYFGAAIHTAHRLGDVISKRELVEYWCQRAVETSAGIVSAMVDFVDARTSNSPIEFSAAQQSNLASRYLLQLQHGWNYDYLDIDVIQAIEKVLENRFPKAFDAIRRFLISRRAIGGEPIDLIHPRSYLWDPLEQFFPDLLRHGDRAYYRAPWPRTDFCLIAELPQDIELTLAARVPKGNRAEPNEIKIAVNREPVATVTLSEGWNRITTCIDASSVASGVNRLSIEWPLPRCSGEAQLESAVNQLKQGREADIHPIFGEIYSLVARQV